MKTGHLLIGFMVLLAGFSSCTIKQNSEKLIAEECVCTLDPKSIDSVSAEQQELDYFYSLMAYAVVFKDWQTTAAKDSSRGYNIGSVLVGKDHYVVNWARNSVNITMNGSQHGEVRLMQSYLEKTRSFSLKGFTIYTSLEPCAMCSGMMKLTQIYRTVYGQTDPGFGKALERLQLESASCCKGGYSPYPRPVISDKSPDPVSIEIDSAYAQYQGGSITDYLATPVAELFFDRATKMFERYNEAKYPQNQAYIDSAHVFYQKVVPPLKKK